MQFEEWLAAAQRKRYDLGTLTVPLKFLALPCGCERKKIPWYTRRKWISDRAFLLIRVRVPGGFVWKHTECGKEVGSSAQSQSAVRAQAIEVKKEKHYFV